MLAITGLEVTQTDPPSLDVLVSPGILVFESISSLMHYHLSDTLTKKISPLDEGQERCDRVVIRFDAINQKATCEILKGVPVKTDLPHPPSITSSRDKLEIYLARLYVSSCAIDIVDERYLVRVIDTAICWQFGYLDR